MFNLAVRLRPIFDKIRANLLKESMAIGREMSLPAEAGKVTNLAGWSREAGNIASRGRAVRRACGGGGGGHAGTQWWAAAGVEEDAM
jgi:hypothetical protein